MTLGPATLIAAAALSTLAWWIARRVALPEWLCLFVFGLVLVLLAGPLVRLP